LSICVTLGTLALGISVMVDARQDAWHQAQQSAGNLALALERDIAQDLSVYDLSIQDIAAILRLPDLERVSPTMRRAALFDKATTEYLGTILVLDSKGTVILDSAAPVPDGLNLADRDYFRVHKDHADVGLYISQPFQNPVRGGDPSIAISRRLTTPDGRFDGVIVGTLRLAYFQNLFSKFSLGPKSSVTLLRDDGVIITRRPVHDSEIGQNIDRSVHFNNYFSGPSGDFVAHAVVDHVDRLYTFRHVGSLPLIVSVNVSVDEIYAAWWPRALTIGGVLIVLCSATLVLYTLFRREILRRVEVEAALVRSAETLSVMAATDSLTELANRRALEQTLRREFKSAIRDGTSLALLMLDADCFKLYNDRYGHQAGDIVLQTIAECIRTTLQRPDDLAARYGGEEFVVLLPTTGMTGAHVVAEEIRAAVLARAIEHADGPTGRITVSIGAAVTHPVPGNGEEALLKMADDALYAAKRQGRNQVVIAALDEPRRDAAIPETPDADSASA
jgi:diguanylate cyclase (GGDEF)-like protein